jgi:hypothetical protein
VGHADASTRPEEKAAWRTASATVWIAIFTVALTIVGAITLYEVVTGSSDTHDLAEAAKKQAAASVQQVGTSAALAIAAKQQSDNTATLAAAAGDQVKKLRDLVASTAAQNSVLRDQLEATDRPWIKIVGAVADHPVIFHAAAGLTAHGKDYINLGIKVIVQNVGRSVALDVITRADVVFVSMVSGAANNPFTYPVAMQKAFCSKPETASLPINLFPGEDNRDQTGDDHDIPVAGRTFMIPQDSESLPRLMPVFVGCVDYKISASGKSHQNGFIYSVQQLMPGHENGALNRGLLVVGNDIPIADLTMERFVFGGFYAN